LTLDGGELSASRPGHFISGKVTPVTHCIGGWFGLQVRFGLFFRYVPTSYRSVGTSWLAYTSEGQNTAHAKFNVSRDSSVAIDYMVLTLWFIAYCQGDQIEKVEMGGECKTLGRSENCIQNFRRKTWKEETTWKS